MGTARWRRGGLQRSATVWWPTVGEDDMEAAACSDLRIELANLGSGVPSSLIFEEVGVDADASLLVAWGVL